MDTEGGGAGALPLAGVRVLDLADGRGEGCGRLLADLGADVVRVEAPGGTAGRRRGPSHAGMSLAFAARNANKRSVQLDPSRPPGRDRLRAMAAGADILIESGRPGGLAAIGCAPAVLWEGNPALVVTSVTDFGQTGPWRDVEVTDEVHLALCGMLSQSGLPGRPPLLPPSNLAAETAAAQAAWATLLAHWVSLGTGRGDHVDVSIHEALVDTLDPPFGIQGSATTGISGGRRRDRPDGRHRYPIIPCADGHVRLCVLSARHWHGLLRLVGNPPQFRDGRYDQLVHRYREAAAIDAFVGEVFASRTRADLVAAGQAEGVPIEAVCSVEEVLRTPHFAERGAFVDLPLPGGAVARMPDGPIWIDGRRAGIRSPAPALDERADGAWAAPRHAVAGAGDGGGGGGAGGGGAAGGGRPLAGLRVLDLGVIVVGAETSRLFADQGADVIKIETAAFPDGMRQTIDGSPISANFAAGHRNERSLGLNLREGRGRELFLRLVAGADVVAANFKPGTLAGLGLGPDELRAANPRIVTVESSGLGETGPWSRRLGYGPLVRSVTGLTDLWRYPSDPEGHCDGVTVYPDHTGARLGALGALAVLVARRRTGRGGAVTLSQAEVVLHQFADRFALASLEAGTFAAGSAPAGAPHGVYPCAGDDEWAVVTVTDDREWAGLCEAMGAADLAADPDLGHVEGRRRRRAELDRRVAAWTGARDPRAVTDALRRAGVPAGAMARSDDLLVEPQLVARRFFATQHQPRVGDIVANGGPAVFDRVPPPLTGPAPLQGEHTRPLAMGLLGLDGPAVDELVAAGILEERAGVGA